MKLTGKTRRQLLLQNIVYCVLLVVLFGLLGWAGVRYSAQFDWSAGNRNSLSQASRDVLAQLEQPVTVSVYIAEDDAGARTVREWLEGYQRLSDRIKLVFVDPRANPAETRRMNIQHRGEVVVEYGGREERLQQFSEEAFTGALQRLIRGEQRWVVFITGHGERNPYGDTDQAMNVFTRALTDKGFKVQSLNLIAQGQIPDNTHVLVIASPVNEYQPGEVRLIDEYIENGGNLLWLAEPIGLAGLQRLADRLGLKKLPGTVIDPSFEMYGVDQPGFVFIVNYPNDRVMPAVDRFTLFPHAFAWELTDRTGPGFESESLLRTLPGSWTETGALEDAEYTENSDDRKGPFDIGLTFSRTPDAADDRPDEAPARQRIAAIGDGDFLSNGFIDTGANKQLGVNLMNWLSGDDSLIDIEPVSAPDTNLSISERYFMTIAVLFTLVLPGVLLAAGVGIWLKRRKA